MSAQVDSTVDYYKLMNVASTASPQELQHAYRVQSKKYHPDCGGTHEQFVQLNLAWEILSNAEMRAKYDAVRSNPLDATANAAWETAKAAAAVNATQTTEKYSGSWTEFQTWMDNIANDFESAQYWSRKKNGRDEAYVSGSSSGVAFIKCGRAVGAAIVFLFIVNQPYLSKSFWQNNGLFLVICAPGVPAFGGFVGQRIHRILRYFVIRIARWRKSSPVVIQCRCGQRLRVPETAGVLKVTCKKCRRLFGLRTCFNHPHEVCPACECREHWDGLSCTACARSG